MGYSYLTRHGWFFTNLTKIGQICSISDYLRFLIFHRLLRMNRSLMQSYILHFLGLPYIWGGDDPIQGFDCSGFVQEFLLSFGAHPDPKKDLTAQGLYNELVKTGMSSIKEFGAIAFYGKSYSEITHVAVLLDSKSIFEFGGGGSLTKSKEDAVTQNAYGRIRPLTRRNDLVTCIMPKYP